MVIDTSALLAILLNEPERRAFNEAIEGAASRARPMLFQPPQLDGREREVVLGSRRGCLLIQVLELPQFHGLITEACDDFEFATHRLDIRS